MVKNRCRVLNNERGLHYSPLKATRIINASCAVHNICIHYNKNDWLIEEVIQDPLDVTDIDREDVVGEAARTRDAVANSMMEAIQ